MLLKKCSWRQPLSQHHKPDSSTTKLRVVFDASAPSSTGKSLNNILRVGPTVQSDLLSILFISTPQGRDVQTNNFKTNLQIERLVLEKRRLRRTWKKSIIIMIPKPGKDHTIPSSYRPISLLSCLSKLFEKCF